MSPPPGDYHQRAQSPDGLSLSGAAVIASASWAAQRSTDKSDARGGGVSPAREAATRERRRTGVRASRESVRNLETSRLFRVFIS
jgi:hypothetical protein